MSVYVAPDKLEDYFEKYTQVLKDKGFTDEEIELKVQNQAKNEVIITYTKEWMDKNLDYWINMILDVPGGYWIVQDLIHRPHCEYEHYRWRHKMSYEKGNVGDQSAKRELTPRSYEVYQIAQKLRANKKQVKEFKVKSEIYVKK